MNWSVIAPDGTKSVRQNQPILQGNTTYTTTFMNKDHFWGDGVNEDGYHRYTTMQKVTTNPIVPVDMDLTYFARQKTALESPSNQDVQPFTIDQLAPTAQVLQLLGMRVCGVVNVTVAGVPTVIYKHNLTSVAQIGVAKNNFLITFPTLPSEDYGVIGGAMPRSAGSTTSFAVNGDSTSKTSTTLNLFSGSTINAPLQFWFAIFGG
jgi:hypothetical protein